MQHLNELYAQLKARGGAQGQPLSVATVRRLHAVLHKALNDAAKQDVVAHNVASRATLPKRDVHLDAQSRGHVAAWTGEELRTFLSLVEGHRFESAFVLAASTGMRRGEVAGLLWDDVDLDAQTLHVRHGLGVADGRLYHKLTKTNRPRSISSDVRTAAALTATSHTREHNPSTGSQADPRGQQQRHRLAPLCTCPRVDAWTDLSAPA